MDRTNDEKKTVSQKIAHLSKFKLAYLKPVIGVVEGLTDPVCGLIMGKTAENLANEFNISRDEQDEFALESHQKAVAAAKKKYFHDEVCGVRNDTKSQIINDDFGPRQDQTFEKLAKLRPYFDRHHGTVTVGNSCPLTDGAAGVVLMSESKAKKLKLKPIGFISGFEYAGLEPHRMGLGPVFAAAKLLKKRKEKVSDFDRIEINEAFAAQVIANLRAFESDEFAVKELGLKKALGKINPKKLNVNGGAIALGHPVGMTGTRLVITLLKELKRKKLKKGLATLCIGGGQGGAMIVEAN